MSGGMWAQASAVAAKTPANRNRYVDFLRALSIGAVVFGHWLVAAVFVVDGELYFSSMLEYQSWTRWLTWLFQVMPVFFLVGGYSNGVSWLSAQKADRGYAVWLRARLTRLLGPVLPLIAVWIAIGVAAGFAGVDPDFVGTLSQTALIPIWFLAVYVMVVLIVPWTYAAWQRWGLASFWILVLLAIVDDVLFFSGARWVGWFNYAFCWLAVHQLGYAWRDGYVAGSGKGLLWAAGGAIALIGMVTIGPYPVSMVSVPGQDVSNTLPPKLPMLALGLVQSGLLLAFEPAMRRWLERAAPWTATVLINSMIMTVFLWHMTAATLAIGAATLIGNVGLDVDPRTGLWWGIRPIWLLVYAAVLVPFALVFGRFERGGGGRPVAAWRLVGGATLVCGGLALVALDGIAGAGEGPLGLRLGVLVLPFLGAALAAVNPFARRAKKKASS